MMNAKRASTLRGLRYIYIIECEGRYKVGISAEPGARLSYLQVGSPFPLRLLEVFPCPGKEARPIEMRVHRDLKKRSVRGEWFDADFATVQAAVVSAFNKQGVAVLSLDTLAHKLAEQYLKMHEGASTIRQSVVKARVGHLIDPALS